MKISGKIMDSNNEPLHLANITIITGEYNNKKGTIAKEDGSFELESDFIEPDSEFKISYQGFKPQTYKASELQDKKIKMLEDATLLNEIFISNNRPTSNKAKQTINNVKDNFNQHKMIYAGLGGILGLALILMNIKKK